MKRGLSPLVVTLLLILVGVAASLVIYMWLTGFASSAVQVPSEMKINIRLEAADLYANESAVKGAGYHNGTVIVIYGRNVGSTTIDITALKDIAVYIYDHYTGDMVYENVTSANLADVIKDFTGDHLIEPGEAFNITMYGPENITVLDSGKYYDIKVVIAGVESWLTSVKAR